MLHPLPEISLADERAGSQYSLSVDGPVGVVGAARIGRRLLATINDGAYRVLLDLSGAQPIAASALIGTLLRIDRYATGRGARLVVVSGGGMEATLDLGNTRGLLTVAATREQAEALLARGTAISAPFGRRRESDPSPRADA
jgi:hypothetical protein